MKFDHTHLTTNQFIGSLYFHIFLPYVEQPTKINIYIALIYNIYPNVIFPNTISSFLTLTVAISFDIFSVLPSTKLIFLREFGPSLIKQSLFLTTNLQIGRII